MSKLFFYLLILAILIPGCKKQETVNDTLSLDTQNIDPLYFYSIYAGAYVCEFAMNGSRKDIIQEVEPYVINGRFYFIALALPLSTGDLKPGFEFDLDMTEDNPRIKAVYRGASRINPITDEDMLKGLLVSGYAERGSIIITNVILSAEEESIFLSSIRFSRDPLERRFFQHNYSWEPITEGSGETTYEGW
jgi:hypothetical protein